MKMVNSAKARKGAATSVVILTIAFFTQSEALVALIGGALLLAFLGGINFLTVLYKPSGTAEHPLSGIRLAQLLGATFAFLGLALNAPIFVVILAALQFVLAVTGICVACKFYGITKYL